MRRALAYHRRRSTVLAALGLTGVLMAGLPVALPASAEAAPWLSGPALEQLRNSLAVTAPVGSATYVDPATNTVVMRIPGRRTAALEATVARHAGQLRIVENAAAATTMANLYGGVRMETAFADQNQRTCTTGFFATGGGWTWNLTAGHCVKDGIGNTAHWYTTGGYLSGGLIGVGTNITPNFPGRDYGAVQISRISPYQPQPYVVHFGGLLPIHTLTAPPRVGILVCKSGQVTGTNCGGITELNVSVTYHEGVVHGLIATNLCVAKGDSGGPLYSHGLLAFRVGPMTVYARPGYGILSGGDLFSCGDPTYRSYFQPVAEVLSAYGMQAVTVPATVSSGTTLALDRYSAE